LIGDMVASRSLTPSVRSRVQEQFTTFIETLNRQYAADLRAKFVITLGDEFQAILRNPARIPQLIWTTQELFTVSKLRLGFGFGPIYTSIKEYAINVDGPALHNARSSIDVAKKAKVLGGVFTGFGPPLDAALNGFARVLDHQRANWPSRQREVVHRLHEGRKGTEVAQELGISKQAVSRYAALAGWHAYEQAEQGMRALLETAMEGHK
jgi:hypothetical protein